MELFHKAVQDGRVLSVVIPAFNEEARIGATLALVTAYFRRTGEPYELFVVDDGSRDGTGNRGDGAS